MHQGPAIGSECLSRLTGHSGRLESPPGTARRAREGSQAREPGKVADGRSSGAGETRMCRHPLTRARLPARNRGAPGAGGGLNGRERCPQAAWETALHQGTQFPAAITSAELARYRLMQCPTAS